MTMHNPSILSDDMCRMTAVNLIVVVESVQRLVTHDGSDLNELHIPSLVAVGAALGKLLATLVTQC